MSKIEMAENSVPSATRVTVKNPKLQYRDQMPQEFKQEILDWVI